MEPGGTGKPGEGTEGSEVKPLASGSMERQACVCGTNISRDLEQDGIAEYMDAKRGNSATIDPSVVDIFLGDPHAGAQMLPDLMLNLKNIGTVLLIKEDGRFLV